MKILKPLIIICLTIVCFGFSTPMYDRAEIAPDLPKGDPDPKKGLVVRKHSTAFDVLRESSSDVKLGVRWTKEYTFKGKKISSYIAQVRAPIPDKQPKSFSYIDAKSSFILHDIYAPSISFCNQYDKEWVDLELYLFMAHDFQDKPIIEAKLNDIVSEFEMTQWEDVTDRILKTLKQINIKPSSAFTTYKIYKHADMLVTVTIINGNRTKSEMHPDYNKYNIHIKMRRGIKESAA